MICLYIKKFKSMFIIKLSFVKTVDLKCKFQLFFLYIFVYLLKNMHMIFKQANYTYYYSVLLL